MSRAGFYSENEFRSYPFITGQTGIQLPTEVIVDFGCIMGHSAEFESGVHKIWLYRVTWLNNSFIFEFKTDAPGLTGRSLSFSFHEDSEEFTTRFASDDVSAGSIGSEAYNCYEDVKWEGYLVVGNVKSAAYVLSSRYNPSEGVILWQLPSDAIYWQNGSFLLYEIIEGGNGSSISDEAGLTAVEPALVQNIRNTYVKKIGLANKARTTVTAPESCSLSSEPNQTDFHINQDCIIGDVKVKAGYNCNLFLNPNNNSITISGAVGDGEGQPCEEVPLYDGETSPDGGNLLSGGPQCKDVIKLINGIGGRVVKIQGGLGVTIRNADKPHTITVDPDHSNMALCGYITVAPSMSSSISSSMVLDTSSMSQSSSYSPG
jgi:hypothetical protein